MASTAARFAMRSRGIIKELKQEDECRVSHNNRNGVICAINTRHAQYTREIEMLRSLPNPTPAQTKRLATLERIVQDMSGTIQRTR